MTELLNSFLKTVRENYPNHYEQICEAYKFASDAHKDEKRKSGEPYIIHPLAVATILVENSLDYSSIIAGFLHDVVEDTEISIADIEEKFGSTVAKLVDGVTKIDAFTAKQKNLTEADSIKRLLLAMGNDLRVIFIKLADRLHNMRTVGFLSRERQIRMAKETKELFIPIAERFGIRKIRSELEELTFECLHPEEFAKIKEDFDAKFEKRKGEILEIQNNLKAKLLAAGIKPKIFGWPEHYYSIYKKLNTVGIGKIYGLMLFKVVVPTELDCYRALGIFHKEYEHIPGQIKDFIASQKPNGYKSLHSVLISKDGKVTFKVMIRTAKMDKTCEHGVASLWYEKDKDIDFGERFEKFNELKNIVDDESGVITNSINFIDLIKHDLSSNYTWIFTPKFRPIRLDCDRPTAIDFAYRVHSKVGDNAVSAIVNGKPVSLGAELVSGDVVEIVTSKEDKAPSRNWLLVCKTSFARRRIREYFARHTTEKFISLGKKMLEVELAKINRNLSDLEAVFEDINEELNFSSIHDMYASVGYKSVTTAQIIAFVTASEVQEKVVQESPAEIEGVSRCLKISFPRCCSPLPGDDIVAVIARGGFAIHTRNCTKVKGIPSTKLLSARWKNGVNQNFNASIKVVAENVLGFGAKLLSLLASERYNLSRIDAKNAGEKTCEFLLNFSVKHKNELEEVMKKISKLSEVRHVSRVLE